MSKCRIFVSSTCFDLAAVREDLRSHILGLGHEPLLSEYPSFPVDPDADCVTNCQRNVREHTDLLVLIVGGRRGYLDEKSRKTVTNLEYETARAAGLPAFVFVNRSVQQLLSVWRKNPSADFTPAVDHPEVFQFLDRIYQENRWVFTFEKTAEITETLTTQLSVMLRDLLGRSRAGTLQPFGQFLAISEKAEKLAREKPKYWEYLLTAELLSVGLADVRYRADRVRSGRKHIKPKLVSAMEFTDQLQVNCADLVNWSAACKAHLPRIEEAWGPPGQPGNPRLILQSVEEWIELCDYLVQWEEELAATALPAELLRAKSLMQGWTDDALKELESLPKKLLAPFENGTGPAGAYDFTLTLRSPPVDEFIAELNRLWAIP